MAIETIVDQLLGKTGQETEVVVEGDDVMELGYVQLNLQRIQSIKTRFGSKRTEGELPQFTIHIRPENGALEMREQIIKAFRATKVTIIKPQPQPTHVPS